MPWVVGIDEAGYGPNLGPLVQAAVALHLPAADPAGWDALKGTVRRAHEKLIQETAPGALDPGVARELAGQIGAIRTVVDEALRVLSDDSLRPRYASRMPK